LPRFPLPLIEGPGARSVLTASGLESAYLTWEMETRRGDRFKG
jgi:hypothetical protein